MSKFLSFFFTLFYFHFLFIYLVIYLFLYFLFFLISVCNFNCGHVCGLQFGFIYWFRSIDIMLLECLLRFIVGLFYIILLLINIEFGLICCWWNWKIFYVSFAHLNYLVWAWVNIVVYFCYIWVLYSKLGLDYEILSLGLIRFILSYHVLGLINWAYILVINLEILG